MMGDDLVFGHRGGHRGRVLVSPRDRAGGGEMASMELSAEQHANALVLWRAHRMHRKVGWCRLGRTPGPCRQWFLTREALVATGLLAPLTAVRRRRRVADG